MAESLWDADDHPDRQMGIRRHSDRCFHPVEEQVEEGYIVEGNLIRNEEVADVRIVSREPKAR